MQDTPPPTSAAPVSPHRPARPPPSNRNAGRLVIGISIFGLVAFLGLAVGGVILARDKWAPSVKDKTFLEVKVTGNIADSPSEGGLFVDPNDMPPLLTEVTAAIRRAAKDERITGLYLDIESVPGGWASVQELRDAIESFPPEKPCYAYSEGFDNKSYYLATGCKTIYLPPGGFTMVTGLTTTIEYYSGALDKLGVRADFEHVGDYKSAIEPYQRTGPSDAASEAMNMLIGSLADQMAAGIAKGRGITPEQAQALIDDPPITPQTALDRKLVDGLKYRDEVEDLAGEDRTSVDDYIHSARTLLPPSKKIAVIYAEGAIVDGESGSPLFGGKQIGDKSMTEYFDDVREDDDVAAVVLRVNSPGGSGLASELIWRQIKRTQEKGKPVVVSMGDYAASGGYYIAAPADKIVAEPGTVTGSIGVFGGKMALSGTFEKVGITTYTWQRGQLATLFSQVNPFTDPERAKFREFLQAFYDQFLTRVSDGRHMPKEKVHEVAQGRVWTGTQALERGLVDELGGLDVAILRAREAAKLGEAEEVDLEVWPKRKALMDQIMDDLAPQSTAPEMMIPEFRAAWEDFALLTQVLKGGGVVAMMPGHLEIK